MAHNSSPPSTNARLTTWQHQLQHFKSRHANLYYFIISALTGVSCGVFIKFLYQYWSRKWRLRDARRRATAASSESLLPSTRSSGAAAAGQNSTAEISHASSAENWYQRGFSTVAGVLLFPFRAMSYVAESTIPSSGTSSAAARRAHPRNASNTSSSFNGAGFDTQAANSFHPSPKMCLVTTDFTTHYSLIEQITKSFDSSNLHLFIISKVDSDEQEQQQTENLHKWINGTHHTCSTKLEDQLLFCETQRGIMAMLRQIEPRFVILSAEYEEVVKEVARLMRKTQFVLLPSEHAAKDSKQNRPVDTRKQVIYVRAMDDVVPVLVSSR